MKHLSDISRPRTQPTDCVMCKGCCDSTLFLHDPLDKLQYTKIKNAALANSRAFALHTAVHLGSMDPSPSMQGDPTSSWMLDADLAHATV